MSQVVSDISHRVSVAASDIDATLLEADALITEKLRLRRRESILAVFLHRFSVSDTEIVSLTSSPNVLDGRFFDTLNKIKQIHSDCQILLATENTKAGYI